MRWILLAVVLALLLVALYAAVRRARLRRRVPVRRVPRLRHPVVLAHGVLGFDEIALAGRRAKYFRSLTTGFEGEFHYPRVPPVGSVAARAEKLVALVRELPGARVNVIAHSMGGLDARFAISRLGLGDRIASLVTIGTPHLGTPLAGFLPRVPAFHDLTPQALERFNRTVLDVPDVAYCSIVAASTLRHTNPLLWPSHLYLSARAGANDGLVPAHSQRWGKVLREIEADHWAQVGWSMSFDAAALYEEILRELAALGF